MSWKAALITNVSLGLIMCAGVGWNLGQAEAMHHQAAQENIAQVREETLKLRELVEGRPEKVAALTLSASAVNHALQAEYHVNHLSRQVPETRVARVLLLESANLLHGELAETGEHVRDAASGGLEAQIDQLALLSRRLEHVVGPQLAR